jgi:hypothetical protein
MKTFAGAIALVLLASCAPKVEPPPQQQQQPATTATAAEPPPAAELCVETPNRLCPSDHAELVPSFVEFRTELLDVVEKRDETRLRAMLDPKIRTSFGDGGGIADFKTSDTIWRELETILKLGGNFNEGNFWAPYVYASWPEAVDAFSHVAAIRKGVVIRATPESSGSEVATVDWEILELIPGKQTPGWRHVRTADKKEGWASDADVRSPIGYRAGFSKDSGQWVMNALVAGD